MWRLVGPTSTVKPGNDTPSHRLAYVYRAWDSISRQGNCFVVAPLIGASLFRLERTFRALSHPDELLSKCKELCQKLSQQMMEQGLKAKTVTLKLK
jgi:hypothetical protein